MNNTNILIRISPTCAYDYDDCLELTSEEFDRIIDTKNTPTLVKVGNRVFFNDYTCWGGYDGTCNCYSHPRKSWQELIPAPGYNDGSYHFGPHIFGGDDDEEE